MSKRKPNEPPEHKPPQPYHVHHAAFTDGDATNPPTMAVDAQPRAGDVPRAFSKSGQRAPLWALEEVNFTTGFTPGKDPR